MTSLAFVDTDRQTHGMQADVRPVDVAVLGAGVAGTAAASALERRGISVALIASHERHPPEFRAEKFGEAQMALLDRLGLGDEARARTTKFEGVWLHRFGRIVDRSKRQEYGCEYSGLVDAMRLALKSRVAPVIGRTETIACGPDVQRITLADGRRIEARLLIVATGMANGPREQVGISREVYSPGHTLAAGFFLKGPARSFPFPSLVWTGERFGDRVSYLTLFPLGDRTRANLYVYRAQTDPWARAFRDDPVSGLRDVMPDFERRFGPIEIDGPVVMRPIDLIRTRDHVRDGVVLVGDAFCTVCPVTGTGIDKALTDVDRLCGTYIPRWMATPGMTRDKIADFYADPIKMARDASAVQESVNARAIKVETTLPWKLRRLRSNTIVRMLYRLPSNRFMRRY